MLKLALRNVMRNPKRSIITVVAIIIGTASLIFLWAFIDGINEQMIANTVQYGTGHIKIHRRGFHQDNELALAMSADDGVDALLKDQPLIAAAAPRIEGAALVSREDASQTVMVFGVDPQREQAVTALDNAIIKGRFLSPGSLDVVVGDDLAMKLGLSLGETLDTVVQAADGSLGAERYTVVGIFNSGIQSLDQHLIMIPLASAQDLYSLWGQINSWVILMQQRDDVPAAMQRLKASLGPSYEIYDWQRLLPAVVSSVKFHEVVGYIVLGIVFVVVAAGIANTVLMAVMERTREFGVMLALGTYASRLLSMVMLESLLLGVIGLVLGNGLGIGFTLYWSEKGIDLTRYTQAMETMPGLSGMVYPLLRVEHLAMISGAVVAVSVLCSLWPAWRASRLKPVEAIRGISSKRSMAEKLENHLWQPRGDQMLFLQLAWRNLFRNPRRSLLTSGATAFGMAAFVFLSALTEGYFGQMINNSTEMLTGHVQIKPVHSDSHHYVDAMQLNAYLSQNPQNNVAAWTPRLETDAIASSTSKSMPITWMGIVPASETQVTNLPRYMTQGRYLEEQDINSVIIGRVLAEKLGLRLDDKLVLTLQDKDGKLIAAALRVRGVFDTGSDMFDMDYLFSPLSDMQTLLNLKPKEVSHIALRVGARTQSSHLAAQLSTALLPQGLVAVSWEQLIPTVMQMVDMIKMDFLLILSVVFLVVSIGVTNTLLMSMLERTREFGMLLAIGTQPGQVLRTVLYEALLLGIVGMAAGVTAGLALAQYYHRYGIDLSMFVESIARLPGMTDTLYPQIVLSQMILPGMLLYLINALVALYPAWKAAHLRPIEALRHG